MRRLLIINILFFAGTIFCLPKKNPPNFDYSKWHCYCGMDCEFGPTLYAGAKGDNPNFCEQKVQALLKQECKEQNESAINRMKHCSWWQS